MQFSNNDEDTNDSDGKANQHLMACCNQDDAAPVFFAAHSFRRTKAFESCLFYKLFLLRVSLCLFGGVYLFADIAGHIDIVYIPPDNRFLSLGEY